MKKVLNTIFKVFLKFKLILEFICKANYLKRSLLSLDLTANTIMTIIVPSHF